MENEAYEEHLTEDSYESKEANANFDAEELKAEEDTITSSIHDGETQVDTGNSSAVKEKSQLLYGLNDVPAWYYCLLLSLQNYLFTIGTLVGMPLIIAPSLCLGDDAIGNAGRANLISTVFLVTGICTLLQTILGTRLPIFQGTSFAFLPPVLAILNLPYNQCPDPLPPGFMNSTTTLYNDTDGRIVDGNELWQRRMREVQGAIALSGAFEILLGITGAVGFMMRFIGPLTIAPTIALIGLDLFSTVADNCEGHWGIAVGTAAIVILCSQYLIEFGIPIPWYSKEKKFHFYRWYLFKLFPVLLALLFAWFLCYILTITNVFPQDPNHPNYQARTDIRDDVVDSSPWFRVPYPGQWGLPRVTAAGFVAMIATIVASIVESVGDYYACAKLSEVPNPPTHAINRGISMEGLGVTLAGVFGTGSGTTSFSENVAIIGITRVASRRVAQVGGVIFILLAVIGKFGSIFVTIPNPVIGGILMVMFGMVTSVGLSNLQYVDLNLRRNMFIIGFALLTALTVANWIKGNPGVIQTGVDVLDQIFTVLLSSALFLGGLIGFIFDNTLPGTRKQRGLEVWNVMENTNENNSNQADEYDLPFPTSCCRFTRYVPILPDFRKPPKKPYSIESDDREIARTSL